MWFVYIIRCTDGSLYTGITTDVERRIAQHARGLGAKYFRARARAPAAVVYQESGHTRSTASRREAEIKKLPARAKRMLIAARGEAHAAAETEPDA